MLFQKRCVPKKKTMRQLIFIFLIILTACSYSKNQADKLSDNLTNDHSKDSFSNSLNQIKNFNNKGESSFNVEANQIKITNVTYTLRFLDLNDELENYIVKQTQRIIEKEDEVEGDSQISLEIYALKDGRLVRTISKNAYRVLFSTQFIQSFYNGGCYEESSSELSSLSGETFLKSSYKYYTVEIPNSQIHLYFGFSCDLRDESKLILGELYFAQALPIVTQGKGHYYSLAFKTVSRIIFKARTKGIFDRIEPSSPDITFLKHNDEDVLQDSPEVQTLHLWSYNNVKSLNGVSFPGLKIKFYTVDSISSSPIGIPIKDGLLFGDNSAEKTIYIE
jgi:hypothetical protein